MSDEQPTERPSRRLGSNERPVRLPDQPRGERRSGVRYPLTLRVRYSVLDLHGGEPETGLGHTVDFSSSGLLFTADKPLEPGLKVELWIDWPVPLDGGVQLQLTAAGTVVRNDGCSTALRIQRHSFRTRRRA